LRTLRKISRYRGVSINRAIRCAGILIMVTLVFASPALAQSYSVTDLGGVNSIGLAASPSGTVAGQSDASFGFLWSPGDGMLKLPALPGGDSSIAYGINAKGVIAGESTANVEGFTVDHAVIWTNRKIQDLGTLTTLGQSRASAINASGRVVGAANPLDDNYHAFLWTQAGGLQDLGTLPGGSYCQALAINRFGQIVGYSDTADSVIFGWVWSKSTGMQNLGSLPGGGGSSASAINDLGQIAGGSGCGATCTHAVLWSKTAGSIQDLGVLTGAAFSSATGINNKGEVVGWSGYISGQDRAFVWSQAQGMQDLNNLIPADSGWTLQSASAINDSGQVTGQGTINGATHAFLLTPVGTN
jgi:probable HAF family extracellular repeat protein